MRDMKTTICLVALLSASSAFAATYNVPQDYNTVQDAVDAAQDSDTIIIAPGTYVGPKNRSINLGGKKITVRSTDPADPEVVSGTIIDCQRGGNGFVFMTGETAESKVEGLTITNGNSFLGGAIYCTAGSSPSVSRCVLINNSAIFGGAVASASINSCPKITNCQIRANSATVGGGAVYCNSGSPIVRNCIISGNYAMQGGALYCHYSGNPLVTNSTIAANNAAQRAGGVYCLQASNAALTNTVVWGNSSPYASEVLVADLGAATSVSVSYCDIRDREQTVVCETGCTVNWGQGVISADPCFVELVVPGTAQTSESGDYHLASGSACVDAGNPGFVAEPDETDIDGDQRVAGMRIDIGADEVEAAVEAISAAVDATPQSINLASKAKWITCAITLGEGYDAADIDVSTISLNGIANPVRSEIDESGGLVVKFERSQIESMLIAGESPVLLTISGSLNDGTPFEGSDTVRIVHNGGNGKSKKGK